MTGDAGNIRPIIVTGASGFVGGHAVQRLATRAPVIALTRFSSIDLPNVQAAEIDIADAQSVNEIVRTTQPRAVLHLAGVAQPSKAKEAPDEAWQVNFLATKSIVDAIRAHAPACRLVFAGSSEAYGFSFNRSPLPIAETEALDPVSVYGATKAAADILVRQAAADGLDAICFRPFNHTGPGQSDSYVVSAFASQIARIEKGLQDPVIKVGNLKETRDFLHVLDVVAAYEAAIFHEGSLPPVLNVCSSEGVTIDAMLQTLLRLSDQKIDVETDPNRYREPKVPRIVGSNTALKTALDWQPKWTLEQTLESVLKYWRSKSV